MTEQGDLAFYSFYRMLCDRKHGEIEQKREFSSMGGIRWRFICSPKYASDDSSLKSHRKGTVKSIAVKCAIKILITCGSLHNNHHKITTLTLFKAYMKTLNGSISI